jgi:hypothetical protein
VVAELVRRRAILVTLAKVAAVVSVAAVVTLLLLARPESSSAQADQSTAPQTATTATTGDGQGQATEDQNEVDSGIVVAVLAFGLLVIVALLVYLYLIQERYFDAAERALGRLGKVPPAQEVTAIASGAPVTFGATAAEPLKITGPAVLAVGGDGEAYTVAPGDGEAQWSINTPDDGASDVASVAPATGGTVRVVAKKAGTFIINVTRGAGSGSYTVTAVDLSSESRLPLVGAGYGTLLIALVLLTGAIVLGLEDVLSGEAIATLFGALAGYVFLKGKASDGASSDTPSGATQGTTT